MGQPGGGQQHRPPIVGVLQQGKHVLPQRSTSSSTSRVAARAATVGFIYSADVGSKAFTRPHLQYCYKTFITGRVLLLFQPHLHVKRLSLTTPTHDNAEYGALHPKNPGHRTKERLHRYLLCMGMTTVATAFSRSRGGYPSQGEGLVNRLRRGRDH